MSFNPFAEGLAVKVNSDNFDPFAEGLAVKAQQDDFNPFAEGKAEIIKQPDGAHYDSIDPDGLPAGDTLERYGRLVSSVPQEFGSRLVSGLSGITAGEAQRHNQFEAQFESDRYWSAAQSAKAQGFDDQARAYRRKSAEFAAEANALGNYEKKSDVVEGLQESQKFWGEVAAESHKRYGVDPETANSLSGQIVKGVAELPGWIGVMSNPVTAAMSIGSFYDEAVQDYNQSVPVDQQNDADRHYYASMYSPVALGLEKIGIDGILKKWIPEGSTTIRKLLSRIGSAGVSGQIEGLTEAAQGAVQDMIATGYDPERTVITGDALKRRLNEYIVGSTVGTIGGAGAQILNNEEADSSKSTKVDIEQAINDYASDIKRFSVNRAEPEGKPQIQPEPVDGFQTTGNAVMDIQALVDQAKQDISKSTGNAIEDILSPDELPEYSDMDTGGGVPSTFEPDGDGKSEWVQPEAIQQKPEIRLTDASIDPTPYSYLSATGIPFRFEEYPLNQIVVNKDVPQFKGDADKKTGVVEELGGKFYIREGVAPIVLWEKNNGETEVITGRHRRQKAIATGEKTIPAHIFKESDGFTRDKALTFDAESNIRDGNGTVKDYASYFRGTPYTADSARQAGLFRGTKGNNGFNIGKYASPDLYSAFQNRKISDSKAAAIAAAAPENNGAQLQALRRAKDKTADELEVYAKMLATSNGIKSNGPSQATFGAEFDDFAAIEREADLISKAWAGMRDDVNQRLLSIQGVAKRPELARQQGVDIRDEADLEARQSALKGELERLKNYTPENINLARAMAGLAPVSIAPEVQPVELEPAATEGQPFQDTQTMDMFGGFKQPSQEKYGQDIQGQQGAEGKTSLAQPPEATASQAIQAVSRPSLLDQQRTTPDLIKDQKDLFGADEMPFNLYGESVQDTDQLLKDRIERDEAQRKRDEAQGGFGFAPRMNRDDSVGRGRLRELAVRRYEKAGAPDVLESTLQADGQTDSSNSVDNVVDSENVKESGLSKESAVFVRDVLGRLKDANVSAFVRLKVEALDGERWAKKMPEGYANRKAAYHYGRGVIYLRTDISADEAVDFFLHEAGHFADDFYIPNEITQESWERIGPEKRMAAYREYVGNPDAQIADDVLINDRMARREWVAMQFSRVIRDGSEQIEAESPKFGQKLREWVAQVRDLVRRFVGSGKLADAELDRWILKSLNFTDDSIAGAPEVVSDESNNNIRFAPEGDGFYSQLEQVIERKIQGKTAMLQQVQAIIDPARGSGVKPEEIKWSGINQALEKMAAENGGKVSKDALLDYLHDGGKVRFEEVKFGVSKPLEWSKNGNYWLAKSGRFHPMIEWLPNGKFRLTDGSGLNTIHSSLEDAQKEASDIQGNIGDSAHENRAKFSIYTIPGGKNYREVVLALPVIRENYHTGNSRVLRPDETIGMDNERFWFIKTPDQTFQILKNNHATAQSAFDYVLREKQPNPSLKSNYQSSHFSDVRNYVAHMRLNERDGGLFIEEIQSDRHQDARTKGYFAPRWTPEEEERVRELEKPRPYPGLSQDERDEYNGLIAKEANSGIADAPFRKDWALQMFKRALRDAVESGKEWIGWTSGETQADRYNLSKQVSEVIHWKSNPGYHGIMITAEKGGNRNALIHEDANIAGDKLEDLVGKEIAKRIIDGEGDDIGNDMKALSGDGLKVGGEGMRGFYDVILPKEVQKYVKQWGAVVKRVALGQRMADDDIDMYDFDDATPEEVDELNRTLIWRVSITPQMQADVSERGQVLFAPEDEKLGPVGASDSNGLAALDLPELVQLGKMLLNGRYPKVARRLRALGYATTRDGEGPVGIKLLADIFKLVTEREESAIFTRNEKEVRAQMPDEDPTAIGAIAAEKAALEIDELRKKRLNDRPQLAMQVLAHEIGHIIDFYDGETLSRGNVLGRIASFKKYMGSTLPGTLGDYKSGKSITPQLRKKWRSEAEKAAGPKPPKDAEADLEDWRNDVKELYREKLETYIEDNEILTAEIVRGELMDLSAWWSGEERGFNSNTIKGDDYLSDPKELYAEALSVLLNNPIELRNRAPEFYRGFVGWLENKPEARRLYIGMMELIRDDLHKNARVKTVRNSFRKDEETMRVIEYGSTKKLSDKLDYARIAIDRATGAIYRRLNTSDEANNARESIGNYIYRATGVELYLSEINNRVNLLLKDANLTWEDLGEYMLHRRVIGGIDDQDRANPYGFTSKTSKERLEEWSAQIGTEAFSKLEKAGVEFRKIFNKHVIELYRDFGILDDDLQKLLEDNVYYATFHVQKEGDPATEDALQQALSRKFGVGVGARILKRYGTLQDIRNPATATLQKSLSMINFAYRNQAKRHIAEYLMEVGDKFTGPAEERWDKNVNHRVPVEVSNSEIETLMYMQNGKLKAFYVPAAVNELFQGEDVVNSWVTAQLATVNNITKSLFTQLNYGFWPVALTRDIGSYRMQVPGASFLFGRRALVKHFPAAIKAASSSVSGKPNKVAKEALRRMVLISRGNYKGINDESLDGMERIMIRHGFNPEVMGKTVGKDLGLLERALGKIWSGYKRTGEIFERTMKIAGMLALDEDIGAEIPEWKKQQIIRERSGSPDFLQKPKLNVYMDTFVGLYYNAFKEGMRSFTKSVNENPAQVFGAFASTVLPMTMGMILAAQGALDLGEDDDDDELKKMFMAIPEYDKANYVCIPLGWSDRSQWKVRYLRLPLFEGARLLHGLTWKTYSTAVEDNRSFREVLGYAADQTPSGNPVLNVGRAWWGYALNGKNPIDPFTNRNVIPETEFKAGDGLDNMAAWTWNSLGGGIIKRIKSDARVGDPEKTDLEQALELPVMSNFVGRWVKVSNRGIVERAETQTKGIETERAQEILAARELIRRIWEGNEPLNQDELEVLFGNEHVHDYTLSKLKELIKVGDSLEMRMLMEADSAQAREVLLKWMFDEQILK
jgi:hypothetical protein